MSARSKTQVAGERYPQDVAGMPCFAATAPYSIYLGPESMEHSVAGDDENCAVAQGCRTQLRTPYVSVGRSRIDIAMPHPEGVIKPEYGQTRWAVVRWQLSREARDVVIAADTGKLEDEDYRHGVLLAVLPPKPSELPSAKQLRNLRFREPKGVADGRGKRKGSGEDALTALGVRKLTGQRQREDA